jgi:hypothetical protein
MGREEEGGLIYGQEEIRTKDNELQKTEDRLQGYRPGGTGTN